MDEPRLDRTELRASVRYGRHGPAVRSRHRECPQETAGAGGGMQSRPVDAVSIWSGQAQSSPRSIRRSYFCDSGAHKSTGKRLGGMVGELRQTAASGAAAHAWVDILYNRLKIATLDTGCY